MCLSKIKNVNQIPFFSIGYRARPILIAYGSLSPTRGNIKTTKEKHNHMVGLEVEVCLVVQ
jgi:hypothetical protein